MSIIKSFSEALKQKEKRGWEKLYVLVDIHNTIFKPCYHNEETFDWFPDALEVLQYLTKDTRFDLILWTSSYQDKIHMYLEEFEKHNIKFNMININTEVESDDLGCFEEKTYYNIGIDDKFGFDAMTDWTVIKNWYEREIIHS